jgi:hypothetical protein
VTVEQPTDTVCCTNGKCLLRRFVEITLCRRQIHFHDRNALKLGPILWSVQVFHLCRAAAFNSLKHNGKYMHYLH